MARENIVLHKGNEYTFGQENIGKYKIVAHIPGLDYTKKENIFTDKIIEVINPSDIGDIVSGGNIISGFVAGEDTKYFSILYSFIPEYKYEINELNDAAYIYIKDWNNIVSDDKKIPVNDIPDERPKYFGQDGNGIYALLDVTSIPVDSYDPDIIYISGDHTYLKAYVKGTCSIVDADYSNTNDFNMTPSIAYPLTFQNDNGRVPYLFINSSIQLLKYLKGGTFKFLESDEENRCILCTYDNTLLMDKSLSHYQNVEKVNYIIKFAESNRDKYVINTISEPLNDGEAMMIYSGTNRKIIIPETIKKISHFYSGSNSEKIILPSSLIEIGESAFNGIGGGSIALREYNNNLEVIGEQAFANISNVRIFEFDIIKDKEFILSNMCRGDSTDISKLLLNREQLSNVLDTLASNSVKSICLLPRVKEIKEYAFKNAKNSTSISNIAFSNIGSSVGAAAFLNAEIKNLIIPDPLIVRPESSDNPNTITSSGLLYLPESAIDLACRNLDLTYTHEMKDTIHIDQSVDLKDGYYYDGYDFKPQENNNRLTWLIGNTYKFYKDSSQKYKTFSHINQKSDQTYYFIHKVSK